MDATTRDTVRKATEEIREKSPVGKDKKTDPVQVPPPNVAKNQDNVGKVDYLR